MLCFILNEVFFKASMYTKLNKMYNSKVRLPRERSAGYVLGSMDISMK